MPSSLEQKNRVRACAYQTQGHAQNQTWREGEREAMYRLKLARDKPDIEPHTAN